MEKIINFVPTGTQTTRSNSFAPLTASEIVEEVHEAYEFGITLCHLHARDPIDLSNSYKKEVYQKILDGVRKHCPDLCVGVSLSGRFFSEFEKRSEVLELLPDMASLTLSSLNFTSGESINAPDTILRLIEKMNYCGVIPEIECFDSGMLNYCRYLVKKEILKPPFYTNIILGNLFNAQADLNDLVSIFNKKVQNGFTCLGGIGQQQLKANLIGLLYFDGIRIGLEDNLYFKENQKTTNIELLKRIKNIMDELDFMIMSHKAFKGFGYGNKKLNDLG